MRRHKDTGPQGVIRPFQPSLDVAGNMSEEARQTEALEHIAVSLSAIDHNLDALLRTITLIAQNTGAIKR